jgi:cysteine desulfurase
LKDKFLSGIAQTNLNYVIHSDENCSPYIVSISFLGCRAETILNKLSDRGVYIGNGSACSSKKSGNRILDNMGVSKDEIESNLRISFSKHNTIDEVEKLVDELAFVIKDYLIKVV